MTAGSRLRGSADFRGRLQATLRHLVDRASTPVATYYVLIGSSAMLLGLGLVMVLSASGPTQYALTGSSYTLFFKQLMFAGIGLAGGVVASRLPLRWWKRLAIPSLLLAAGLQGLVFTPLGVSVNGNRNWIVLGGQRLQPSEFGKIAVVLVCAFVLAHKRRVIGSVWHALFPVLPFTMFLVMLVMFGDDMGTAMILTAIVVGALWVAGARLRLFVAGGAALVIAALTFILPYPHRMERFGAWLGDRCSDPHVEGCYQKIHGQYALADGGWLGTGLGESLEKWQWLPEAHNDFIFAIIGEELGLLGSFAVLVLFAGLGFACYRIVCQNDDQFVRIASAGVMVWLVGQAIVNIGSVIGMLPIIGVPLPLVSSGGTALVSSLLAVGLLASFARAHPDVRAFMASRASLRARMRRAMGRRNEE